MRKRNVSVLFRLTRREAEGLDKKVRRSGLSREAYLRHLVNDVVPQDTPPPAYYDFMRELHRVGNNLNQIAQKAHVLNVIDVLRYDEAVRQLDRLVKDITKAVLLPRPMEGLPQYLSGGETGRLPDRKTGHRCQVSGWPLDTCGENGSQGAV